MVAPGRRTLNLMMYATHYTSSRESRVVGQAEDSLVCLTIMRIIHNRTPVYRSGVYVRTIHINRVIAMIMLVVTMMMMMMMMMNAIIALSLTFHGQLG